MKRRAISGTDCTSYMQLNTWCAQVKKALFTSEVCVHLGMCKLNQKIQKNTDNTVHHDLKSNIWLCPFEGSEKE